MIKQCPQEQSLHHGTALREGFLAGHRLADRSSINIKLHGDQWVLYFSDAPIVDFQITVVYWATLLKLKPKSDPSRYKPSLGFSVVPSFSHRAWRTCFNWGRSVNGEGACAWCNLRGATEGVQCVQGTHWCWKDPTRVWRNHTPARSFSMNKWQAALSKRVWIHLKSQPVEALRTHSCREQAMWRETRLFKQLEEAAVSTGKICSDCEGKADGDPLDQSNY